MISPQNEIYVVAPIFGLFDCSPSGLGIFFWSKHGSKKLAFDSTTSVSHDMKWIWLMPKDLEELGVLEEAMMELTKFDNKRLSNLLEKDFVKGNRGCLRS